MSTFVSVGETPTVASNAAITILKEISRRSARRSALFNLHTPSLLRSLSINTPLWDFEAAFNIPENIFSFGAHTEPLLFCRPHPSCSKLTPLWANKLQNRRKLAAPGPPRRKASNARPSNTSHCSSCTAVWDEDAVFPTAPISMNRAEEFVVRTEYPRTF